MNEAGADDTAREPARDPDEVFTMAAPRCSSHPTSGRYQSPYATPEHRA